MRIILSIVLSTSLLLGPALAGEVKQSKKDPGSPKQQMSYSLGYDTGSGLKKNSVDLDPEVFTKAFKEGYEGNKAAMTDEDMRAALAPFRMKAALVEEEERKNLTEKRKQLAEKNRTEGESFLAENAKKEGVVIRPSGLQYKVDQEGSGKQPTLTDKVKVNYSSSLISGKRFDNSDKRGGPVVIGFDQVIKAWTEALPLMKEGAKWTLYVPAHLAYGERGVPNSVIGPYQTIIFEVELISVQ